LRLTTLVTSAALLLSYCSSAPKVTEATRRVAANPRAVVEGVVRDEEGRPVAGVGVRGIPRGKDVPWSPAATTDCAGRFWLALPAPARAILLETPDGQVRGYLRRSWTSLKHIRFD